MSAVGPVKLLRITSAERYLPVMDLDASHQLLNLYVDNARRILDSDFGVDRAERAFFDVIELLREEPRLRDVFVGDVRKMFLEHDPRGLGEGAIPRELVELATHELRWPEFGEIARQRIEKRFGGDAIMAASDPATTVLEAYDSAWEDREFYRRYQSKPI